MNVTYNGNVALFDGYKFRRDAKTGYYLSTKKTDTGHRERLHCYVWRYYKGAIPEGYHVHHADENKDHNDIENLLCIPGDKHVSLHGKERAAMHPDRVRQNLIEYAVPKSKAWHSSAEGRAWHSEHGKITWEDREPRLYKCAVCGKEFYSRDYSLVKFCSNKCKAAARRKSGVDDETRKCVVCGREYTCNKYSKSRTCSPRCSGVLQWDKSNPTGRQRTRVQHGG